MVESILEYLAGEDTIEDVLGEFQDLQRGDILACLVSASMKLKDIEVPVM